MNTQSKDQTIVLEVKRGVGEGPSALQQYELPAEAAASLLDGLRWVREHLDDTLAVRYSCISANACKECMMLLDGKVVYACVARMTPGATHQVEPLANKARVRDLISEIAPVKERFERKEGTHE
ncbi:MAG TPA: 2Fe-2S iron-sulfur cluster-binding protein [Pusillimonas sp.]|uniref:2Fe-2S iron-sulfur cluster-binding protein n=1 Tax=Pusillimonas sp. TaxID=3040095 RepID=UPI002C42B995|nr:2Fe-2S iron-sulfur cluster-binding protein [Pusillimonas sp.]HUH86908.1 2Fe-2S iron-sulfur cluster-binding protein [Pusillimonas sp.]